MCKLTESLLHTMTSAVESSLPSASAMLRSCSILLALVICCLAMSEARAEAAPSFPEFRGTSFGLGPQVSQNVQLHYSDCN